MACLRSTLTCAVLAAVALHAQAAPGEKPIEVRLRSSVTELVLGQTLVLDVTVKNVSQKPIDFRVLFVDRVEPEILTYVSEDGLSFRESWVGIFPETKRPRWFESLSPGESRQYRLRVLYRASAPSRLAIERPGRHWIKVAWWLNTRDLKSTRFESNTIQLEVKQPKGTDAKVWDVLRAPEFLRFLQCGHAPPEHAYVPRKAVEILRKMPKSAYDDALRYALTEHYSRRRMHMNRPREEADPEMRELRELLGIVMEPEGRFPEDRRLDVQITFHFPEWTPREQVFDVISVAGGVPLRVAPELAPLQEKGVEVTMTLRKFMHFYEGQCMWIPEPDGGYRLVPTKAPEQTKVPEPPKPKGG